MYPGQGYGNQGQMFYNPYQNMMTGYGHPFNQQMQQQTPQQQQQQQPNNQQQQQFQQQQAAKNQGGKGNSNNKQTPPVIPGTMALNDDSELPPLPPGPPPPQTQQQQKPQQQHNNNQNQTQTQHPPFMYNNFSYAGWNNMQQQNESTREFYFAPLYTLHNIVFFFIIIWQLTNWIDRFFAAFNGVRFNLPNKKAGLGFQPSGNSGAAKKKRKRNKNLAAQQQQQHQQQQQQQQFNNSFQGNNNKALKQQQKNFVAGDNLKSDLPPLPSVANSAAAAAAVHQPMEVVQTPPLPPTPPPPTLDKPIEVKPLTASPLIGNVVGNIINNKKGIVAPQVRPVVATTNPANASPVGDWPDSLKNYVNRCYEKCKTGMDKDQVEIILKGKITRAANDGSLWVKDWDKEPLPSIYSERMTMTIKPMMNKGGNKLGGAMGLQQGDLRKQGLSTSLGARLGARLSAANVGAGRGGGDVNGRSRQRTSRSHSRSRSRSRSRRRSASRSRSRSPARTSPMKKYRRSTSSSSSSSERDFLHLNSSISANKKKFNNKNKQNYGQGKKNKQKNKQNKQSHFYSEFGMAGQGGDELGSKEKLQQRAARFNDSVSRNNSFRDDSNVDFDFTGLHIIGTCRDLEKPYLRLTTVDIQYFIAKRYIVINDLLLNCDVVFCLFRHQLRQLYVR